MANLLRFTNWEQYQGDKRARKRGGVLPWLKLYVKMLDCYDFTSLPEVTQAHAFKLMLLARKLDNAIPDNPDYIRSSIRARVAVNIDALIACGLITRCTQIEDKMHAGCKRNDPGEEEGEEEGDKETPTPLESSNADMPERADAVRLVNDFGSVLGIPLRINERRWQQIEEYIRLANGFEAAAKLLRETIASGKAQEPFTYALAIAKGEATKRDLARQKRADAGSFTPRKEL